MEFKGTKGKWVYDNDQQAVLDERGNIISDIFPSHNKENGLLISKAPEMLETLLEILKLNKEGKALNKIHYSSIELLVKEATELK